MIESKTVRRLLAGRPMNARQLGLALGISVATVWRLVRRLRREGVPISASRDKAGWHYAVEPAPAPIPIPRGLPFFPRRPPGANKTDFGRVLVVAGSYGMAGAAILACRAAHRTGAGLVTLATPSRIYPAIAPALVETVIRPWDRPDLREILALRADAAAVGPGLGLTGETIALVEGLVRRFDRPLVVDADGINALALRRGAFARRRAPLILTPHEGELSRLIDIPAADIRKNRERIAVNTARKLGIILILKGRGSIVTDGARMTVNPTGNPGMATAGSGDVLTGILAALLGQGFDAFDAARLGVWLHGRAGDLAWADRGGAPLIAGDLVEALPRAIRERMR